MSAELAPYPGDRLGGLQPPLSIMETLPEVDTPKASNYDFQVRIFSPLIICYWKYFQNSMIGSHSGHHLMPDHSNRPLSRTSTHVWFLPTLQQVMKQIFVYLSILFKPLADFQWNKDFAFFFSNLTRKYQSTVQ